MDNPWICFSSMLFTHNFYNITIITILLQTFRYFFVFVVLIMQHIFSKSHRQINNVIFDRYLKNNHKIKNSNVIFHIRSAANEFTKKLFKNFTKLHLFIENEKLIQQK